MSDNSIVVDDLEITPLKQDYKLVHPALGTVNGTAYVGVWFPCLVKGEKKTTIKDLLFLITSDRQKLLANDTVLNAFGWRLQYKPGRFKNRWNLDSVEAYLNGADVDPKSVFDAVSKAWKNYLEFEDLRDYLYHALWDIGTYFYFLFSAYPYAYHGGSTQTGKSKAERVSSLLAFNAILSNNMSTASIFRLVQNARSTLLLDETEKLSTRIMDTRVQEFRSILLSGYQRGGQAVYRVEKDKDTEVQSIVPFDVYGPKRLANIQGLEDIIDNRCKPTIHRRSVNDDIIKVEPNIESEEWPTLRGQLCILFLQHWKEVKTIYDTLNPNELEGLDGRQFELWRPIIALAKFFDSYTSDNPAKSTSLTCSLHTPNSLSSLMIDLAKDTAKQSTVENLTEAGESILLQVLLDEVHGDEYVSVKGIRDKVVAQFDEQTPWVTTRWVGNTLKRLGFKDKRRVGSGYQYRLNLADVKDIAERMGVKPQVKKEDDRQPKGPQKTLDSSEHGEPSVCSERNIKVFSEHVKALTRLKMRLQDRCSLCEMNGRMEWQADLFDGSYKFLCDTCGLELEKRLSKNE
jgi:hypothetical protein